MTRLVCSNPECQNASEGEALEPEPTQEPAPDPMDRPLAALLDHEGRVASHEVSPVEGCMTGICDLNWLVGTLRPGELRLIEGPAGAGKTTLLLQALGKAVLWRHASALISLELGEEVLLRRLLSSLTRVEPRRVGYLDREDARRYAAALCLAEALELHLRAPPDEGAHRAASLLAQSLQDEPEAHAFAREATLIWSKQGV